MKFYLFVSFSILFTSLIFADEIWFSKDWKVKRLICPFGCSNSLSSFYKKDEKVKLQSKTYGIPSFGTSCIFPNKANWNNVKKTKLGVYLDKWTQNKKAIENPKTKKKIVTELNLTENTIVWAGLVSCSNRHAFNFIYVSSKKAYILFEENSFWEIYK